MTNLQPNILIVDDDQQNIFILKKALEQSGYIITVTLDGKQAIESIENTLPDLILMDIQMPVLDGFEAIKKIKVKPSLQDIPIIFLTAINQSENIIKAFELGAADYILKPFNIKEVTARVRTHIKLQQQKEMLMDAEMHLIHMVDEKTRIIEQLTISIVQALENANLVNDDDTGNHIKRVSHYASIIASAYGCDPNFVNRIKLYSTLHDIGKVGLPDHILKKSGTLTNDEFEQMKQHVIIGHKMIDNIELDQMAKNIVLYHHERWDGSGYINKLIGEQIPLEARITTIADIYDALTTERSYKSAVSQQDAENIIKQESGRILDPSLVEIFFKKINAIIEIKETYK